MTVRVFLVRHGAHDLLGKVLCGRMDGVGMNAHGFDQADAAGARLAGETIRQVFSSPILRAHQTAEVIARHCACPIVVEPALAEIDIGEWTGATFEALHADPRWHTWNSQRKQSRAPGGESMVEVQTRVADWLRRIGAADEGAVVAVSHADVIKAACCTALDLPLDHYHRFDIDPCSVSELHIGAWGMRLAGLNRA